MTFSLVVCVLIMSGIYDFWIAPFVFACSRFEIVLGISVGFQSSAIREDWKAPWFRTIEWQIGSGDFLHCLFCAPSFVNFHSTPTICEVRASWSFAAWEPKELRFVSSIASIRVWNSSWFGRWNFFIADNVEAGEEGQILHIGKHECWRDIVEGPKASIALPDCAVISYS